MGNPKRWALTVLAFALATAASAQVPEKFTNLKVLPQDIGRGELVGIMRGYADALDFAASTATSARTPSVSRTWISLPTLARPSAWPAR